MRYAALLIPANRYEDVLSIRENGNGVSTTEASEAGPGDSDWSQLTRARGYQGGWRSNQRTAKEQDQDCVRSSRARKNGRHCARSERVSEAGV